MLTQGAINAVLDRTLKAFKRDLFVIDNKYYDDIEKLKVQVDRQIDLCFSDLEAVIVKIYPDEDSDLLLDVLYEKISRLYIAKSTDVLPNQRISSELILYFVISELEDQPINRELFQARKKRDLEIAPQKKDRDQLTNGARVITPLPTTIRNENDNVFVPNTGALKAAPGEPNHIELTHTDRSFLSHQTNENESKLSHAIHKRQNVFFDYVDQYDDDSSRHVMPKGIFQRNNQKFLEAYDYGRAAKRHFLLSRISNLSVEEANQNRSDQKSHKEHEKLTDSFVLNTNNETILVFFDFETNGLDSSSSVLSFSALKVSVAEFDSYSWRILKTIDRYYFPEENYNPHAIKVNGLTEMKIKEKRGYVSTYPKNYKDDAEVELFFRDVDLIIAHNFDFDKKFLHPEARKIPSFCTMKSNIEFVGIYRRGGKTFKWPKLIETANAYGIAFDESKAHGSLYDTEICMEIFKNMLQMKKISISKQN